MPDNFILNLAESPRLAGRVGFGCVGLTAMQNKRDALRLLEHTYELGIRHFDTARAYGMGKSEEVLGEFARTRRESITITTKFGISPPPYVSSVPFLSEIKRALKKLPFLDRQVRRTVGSGGSMGNFNSKAAKQSLDASLKALKTDYIDFWLLHEATIEMTKNIELLEFLESRKAAGQIRHIGIGSAYNKILGNERALPEALEVLQFENNILTPTVDSFQNFRQSFIFSHSALLPAKAAVNAITADQDCVSLFREKHGLDLSNLKVVTKLMFAWALETNSSGCVLFGSTSPDHIDENMSVFSDERISKALIADFQHAVAAVLRC